MDFPGGVEGGALYGVDAVHAVFHRLANHLVHVAHIQDIVRFPVVGAEAEVVVEGVVPDPGHDIRDVLSDGTLPRVYMDAGPQLGDSLPGIPCLMAADGSSDEIGREHPPVFHAGHMALDIQAVLLRRLNDVHHPVVPFYHADKVHHLSQPDDVGQLSQTVYRGGVNDRPGVLQPWHRRHAGGNVDELAHGQVQPCVVHIVYRFLAKDVGDLVRVGDHGGGAPRNDSPGEVPGGHHTAFNVDMGVDKARNQEVIFPVYHLFGKAQLLGGVLVLHMDHKALVYKYGGGIDFTGEYIDIADVGNCQVAGNLPHSGLQQLALVGGLNFHGNSLLS